jgi:hypothetical protein
VLLVPALSAPQAFRLSDKRACQLDPSPIPAGFIKQLPLELSEAHIPNGLSQPVVLHHTTNIQIFNHQHRLGFRQPGCDLMQRGVPLIAYLSTEAPQPRQYNDLLRDHNSASEPETAQSLLLGLDLRIPQLALATSPAS